MDQKLLYQKGESMMRTRTKVWLIIATSLVLIGCILFAGAMTTLSWDFTKLSTTKYVTNTYEISKAFDGISMNTDTADITFAVSDNGKCAVECYEEEKTKHSVAVEEDTLIIKEIDNKSWYDNIGINFSSPKITIYLPKTNYTSLFIEESTGSINLPQNFKFEDANISLTTGNVNFSASASELIKIKTSTGSINIKNISAGALELSVSTGKVSVSDAICEGDININVSTGKTNLNNIECKNLTSNGDTGDIFLNHIIATEKFSIERDTGDVRFNSSDANEIFVETDTGDVIGSLLTDKVFITHTDTGKIDIPKTAIGGRCEIETDTGDIKLEIK